MDIRSFFRAAPKAEGERRRTMVAAPISAFFQKKAAPASPSSSAAAAASSASSSSSAAASSAVVAASSSSSAAASSASTSPSSSAASAVGPLLVGSEGGVPIDKAAATEAVRAEGTVEASSEDSAASKTASAAAAASPAPHAQGEPGDGDGGGGELSEYEQVRLANIRRNEALLAQLGLHGATAQLAEKAERKRKAAKRKRAVKPIQPTAPTRRSSRKRGAGPVAYTEEAMMAAAAEEVAAEEVAEEAELDYDDSSVVRYTCDATGSEDVADLSTGPATGRIVGFRRRAAAGELVSLYDGELSRTYSMQMSRDNRLLAAAGHGGRVSLFGIHSHTAQEDPLLSWKAHKGWVAGVAFAGAGAGMDSLSSQRLLLTASNDKTVVLWDLHKAANGVPKAVTRTDRLHASGIFSLDLAGTHVLTAGKDARSVLSTLRADSGELSVVRSFEEHRSTVTKCARFRPHPSGAEPTVFADCGNDMCVCVLDLRSSTANPSVVIEGEASHGAVINSVAWHPTNEHILASVSDTAPAFL